MTTGVVLLTAEEYRQLPDDGRFTELVRGEVVEMARPTIRHGEICVQIAYLIRRFLENHPTGRVIANDPGVITERGPDTVRGPDVAYLSYTNYPKGPLPKEYAETPPEVVFEVRSPSDRWADIGQKVAEYLAAGVSAACVADEDSSTVTVYRRAGETRFIGDQEVMLPEIHADLRIAARRFFE